MADAPQSPDDQAAAAAAAEPDGQGAAPAEGAPGAGPDGKPDEPSRSREFNRAFAALSRREKALKERDTSWAAEREKHAAELKELATFRQLRQGARQNPRAWLEAGAIDRDTAAQAFAEHRTDGQAPRDDGVTRELQAKLQQLEAQLAERDQKYQQMAANQAKAGYLDRIDRCIDSDPAAYELLKAEGRQADVYELMDRHYREHHEVLKIPDACAALEAALTEQLTTQAQRYRGYKKLAPRLGWTAPEDDQPAEAPPPEAASKPSPKPATRRSARPGKTAPPATPKAHADPDAEWAEKVRRFQRG